MDRIAFSSNAFKTLALDDAARQIAAAGYRGIEVMADAPHALPSEFGADRRAAFRALLSDLGLAVSNINAFTLFASGDTYHPTWIEHDPADRRRRIDHTLASVRLAADLGSPTISLQPGGPLIGTGLSRQTAEARFAEGLRAVLPTARDANIILAVEPEPGLLIESAAEWIAFRRLYFADEPLVRMNCDLGHHFCVGEDPAAVLRDHRDELVHVHLEDIGANRVHWHLPLGTGAIDLPSVFAALADTVYAGWVTVELYPYVNTAADVAAAAMKWLREELDKPLAHSR